MNWDKLICDKRLGMENYTDNRSHIRSDFQRDYDRLIFSSPFRRLQNKTQVFPLPGSIFVHNRLTHSLEVSGVGRSIANEVANVLILKYKDFNWCDKLNGIGEIVAAACLAHDLGNPPFGHSGEKCISAFFSEGAGQELKPLLSDGEWCDLIHFEGNANSFRLLTHQFKGRRKGGFAMTYSLLASIVKYPYASSLANGKGKFGFFTSESDTFKDIASTLGIINKGEKQYARHPLVYLVEAADDICYQIMDIEDAHKLKILNTRETIDLLLGFFEQERSERIKIIMGNIDDKNEKIGYLRSCAIGELVNECATAFVANEESILSGTFDGCLIDSISEQASNGYRQCSAVAYDKIYRASDVVDIELAGNQIITFLLEKLIDAVRFPDKYYSQLLLNKVPQQYDVAAPSLYGKIQAVIDHISGMTDVYALDLYRKLNGMSLPAV
ncbi:MAG: deoxyguanosinetriphosphate triphosphohydrolase [Muribaculaceae bacterium]|nr:deoxyguanosinetriphosphate triphosphohydrolase [Muribaculaceae bacterium]